MKRIIVLILAAVLFAPAAYAADSPCTVSGLIGVGVNDVQANALGCDSLMGDVLPSADGTYDLGSSTKEWEDLYVDGTAYIDALTSGTLSPSADDTNDLGAAANEWKDLYVDGVAHIDTVDVDVAFGSDVALSINATDLGLQADTADGSDDQTVKVCGGGGGTGCDAEGRGAWLVLEGADVGGAGVGGAVNLEGGAGDGTADVTIATNHDDADILLRGGTTQATRVTIEGDTGDVTLATGTVIQTEKLIVAAANGRAGATATVGYVNTGTDNMAVTLAQSATADTWVIPITGLNRGDTVTAFSVHGQIESAGNTVTVDADLRKMTAAAGDPTDASVGAITQVSATADTKLDAEKTGLTETLNADESLYVLITITTAASTDVQLLAVELTVTKGNE